MGTRIGWLAVFPATLSALLLGVFCAAALAASPPSIEGESATFISSKRAVLNATIDPNGLETTYEFWIEFADCQNTPPGDAQCESISIQKVGEGHIAGPGPETVVASYSHLQPEYKYDFWVVAKNDAGETTGKTQQFTALPAPVIESEAASEVTVSDATLEAQIDPEGQAVYYQFQVVANSHEYAPELLCPTESRPLLCGPPGGESAALPIGYLPAGEEGKSVSLDLASAKVVLRSGATYHYRVIVAPVVQTEDTVQWVGPPTYGADQTFATSSGTSSGPAPEIESVSLANLTSTDATLGAQIDTEGLETTYEFKMWASPCGPKCELIQDVHLPSGKLLGSFVSQTVSLDLASAGVELVPGGEYGYSLTATSAGGTSEHTWQTFTAPAEEILPPGKDTGDTGGNGPGGDGNGFYPGTPPVRFSPSRVDQQRHHKHHKPKHSKHSKHRGKHHGKSKAARRPR